MAISINHSPHVTAIKDMHPGQYGVTGDGRVYFRTEKSATCLSAPMRSYTGNVDSITEQITILKPGTVITITIDP